MNDMDKKLQDLRSQLSNSTKTPQINVVQKIATVNYSYTDYSSRFNELPHFCKHLPDEFKNAVISLKELHNTPYEFSLIVLLGMANNCIQHLYDVNSYKYGIRPTSLFIMLILGTGGSKSTIEGELKGPLVNFQKRMWEAFSNEDARYASEMKIYKNKINKHYLT